MAGSLIQSLKNHKEVAGSTFHCAPLSVSGIKKLGQTTVLSQIIVPFAFDESLSRLISAAILQDSRLRFAFFWLRNALREMGTDF